jgi:hypothetical protein
MVSPNSLNPICSIANIMQVVVDHHEYLCAEEQRLKEDRERTKYWKRFGTYLSERQWATGLFNQTL